MDTQFRLQRYTRSQFPFTSPNSDAQFSIVFQQYEGSRAELPLDSFADSLKALSKVFDSVQSVLSSKQAAAVQKHSGPVRAKVAYRASNVGSIEIVLAVVEVARSAWSGFPSVVSHAKALRDCIVGGRGLFEAVRTANVESDQDSVVSKHGLTIESDGVRVLMSDPVALAFVDKMTREDVSRFVNRAFDVDASVEEVILKGGSDDAHIIRRSDINLYRANTRPGFVEDESREIQAVIVGPQFEGSDPWRIKEPGTSRAIKVTMKDPRFQRAIDGGLRFGRGDIIQAVVKGPSKRDTSKNGRARGTMREIACVRYLRRASDFSGDYLYFPSNGEAE